MKSERLIFPNLFVRFSYPTLLSETPRTQFVKVGYGIVNSFDDMLADAPVLNDLNM